MGSIAVKRRKPFFLEGGTCLEAKRSTRLYLPYGIISQGKKVSDSFTLSDDEIEVGFQESDRDSEELSAVVIFLRPRDRIDIHRSTEAMADGDDDGEIVFDVIQK